MTQAIINCLIFIASCVIFYSVITYSWTRDANKHIDDKSPVIIGGKQYFVFNSSQMGAINELVNNHALIIHQNKVLLALAKESMKDQKGKE